MYECTVLVNLLGNQKIKVMSIKFKIVEVIETGKQFLAKPYFLDGSKHSLFCEYSKDKEPEFPQWSLNNEYNEDIRIVGDYETDKIEFSWTTGIKYKK